ncbi:MAG TPA: hypothetical protein PKW80_00650 [Bacteroidales bacterium]|nr:hypothetical protein [Bacteroidales bacterium]
MKQIIIIIAFIFLAFTGCLNAGETQVNRDTFYSAVDYVNCKIVGFSLKNKTEAPELINNFNTNCNCSESPDFDKILTSIPQSQTATIELAKEIEAIKSLEFREAMASGEVAGLLTSDIFNNKTKYAKLFAFRNKYNSESFNELINELKAGLNTLLSSDQPGGMFYPENPSMTVVEHANDSIVQNLSSEINTLNEKVDDLKSKNRFFIFRIDVLTILLAVLISVFFHAFLINLAGSDPNVAKIKNQQKHDFGRFSKFFSFFSAPESDLPDEKMELKKTYDKNIEELKENIRQLNQKILELEAKTKQTTDMPYHVDPINKKEQKETPKDDNVFYLSVPNPDGSFNLSSVTLEFKNGASIYRFTKKSAGRASFCIDGRKGAMDFALQFPTSHIIPACEPQNAHSFNSRIVTIEEGIAELSGDKWKIVKKAKIRYEI